MHIPRRWPWLFLLATSCGPTPPQRPSVLLITVDTLRADALGIYAENRRTPALDAWAQGATVFTEAAAPMPLTRPSHFSILTSQYPREHGVLNNAMSLPGEATTLAEILSANGYQTAAFVAVTLLDPDSGSAQGFDEFSIPTSGRERGAAEVVDEVLAYLDQASTEEPVFLWVHLFDPHLPYSPPAEFRPAAENHRYGALPDIDWDQLEQIARRNDGNVPESALQRALRLYHAEVESVDACLGRLLAGLNQTAFAGNYLTILTADHGESFENGIYFEHADSLFDGAIRIPLVIQYRDFPAGTRIATQVSNIDIAPTILRAIGLDLPGNYSGRPLQELLQPQDRHVLIQYPFYQPHSAKARQKRQAKIQSVAGQPTARILVEGERVGIRGSRWKFLQQGDQKELYALPAASGGEQEVSADQADQVLELQQVLDGLLEAHPLRVLQPENINPELLETLRALGYHD